jgi:hypothetical protein
MFVAQHWVGTELDQVPMGAVNFISAYFGFFSQTKSEYSQLIRIKTTKVLITMCYIERSGFIWAGIQGGLASTGYGSIVEIRLRARNRWSQIILVSGLISYKLLARQTSASYNTVTENCWHKRTDFRRTR